MGKSTSNQRRRKRARAKKDEASSPSQKRKIEASEACVPGDAIGMAVGTRRFGIHPFYIDRGTRNAGAPPFEFTAPTTRRNALRLLRAMQLRQPVLLEGSPGVGKTSLVSALAAATGNELVRINLSEQTDILDLFGTDLPIEDGKAGEFRWSDGILLQALKAGSWVLLDELNLASQSVLEGLNSCLDHRREVFIPELGKVFKCPPTFRVFACQNPLHEGGGRKGLPRSFLNRFCKVFVEPLLSKDYNFIARALHPTVSEALVSNMVKFNSELQEMVVVKRVFGHSGSPWELNLRDILRWCALVKGTHECLKSQEELVAHFVNLIYLQRFRTEHDRTAAAGIFARIFGMPPPSVSYPPVTVSPDTLLVGLAKLNRRKHDRAQRETSRKLQLLPGCGHVLESLMHCVKSGWMSMLVGPPKSGKTSIIRLLSEMTGNTLHEYSLSRATDTSELLGCYEQHDISRRWTEAIATVNLIAEKMCSFLLSTSRSELKIRATKDIMSCWTAFKRSATEVAEERVKLLQCLVAMLEYATSIVDAGISLKKLRDLLTSLENATSGSAGRFEWVDGDILRAAQNGDWVLLENANLCNPTVLDRLNPLLEPGGRLLINERGLTNGQAMLVEAHPDFRLFLTLDPSNGEVSRSMRNRGVEIYMMQPEAAVPVIYRDAGTLLRLSGIPGLSLIEAMCKLHTELNALLDDKVSLRELSQWIGLFHELLQQGNDLLRSISYSWRQSYLPYLNNAEQRQMASRCFNECLQCLNLSSAADSFYVPGGWPSPLVLREYKQRSREAVTRRDCGYVAYLGAKLLTLDILKQSSSKKLELLNWLNSLQNMAPYFSQKLLQVLHDPEGVIELPTEGPFLKEIEKMMVPAISYMLEESPLSEVEVRKQWAEVLLSTLGSRNQNIGAALKTLKLERQHPVLAELESSLKHLTELTKEEGREELNLASSARILNCESFYAELGGESYSAWRRVASQIGKVACLRRSLMQWQTEDTYFVSSSSASISNACKKIFTVLLPLLRRLQNETLLAKGVEWSASLANSYLELLEWHELVWSITQTASPDPEFLHYVWIRLKPCMLLLCEQANNEHLINDTVRVSEVMDMTLTVGKLSALKPLLWKFVGHPTVPASLEVWELRKEMSAVCQRIWQGDGKLTFENAAFVSNPSLWQLLLKGFSIVLSQLRSQEHGIPREILQVIMETLSSESLTDPGRFDPIPTVKPEGGDDINPTLLCTSGCSALQCFSKHLLQWRSGQELWLQTHPWLRHLVSALNGDIVARASSSVAVFTYNGDSSLLITELSKQKHALQHVISFAMRTCSLSPAAFSAHQQMLWILDGNPSYGKILLSLVHDMMFQWHSSMWEGAARQSFSACRLLQTVEPCFVADLLKIHVQAKDYHARIEQLHALLVQLWFSRSHDLGDALRADLCRASAALQQLVYAHKRLLSDADSVHDAFTFLHHQLLQGTVKDSGGAVEGLERLFQESKHPEVSATFCNLVVPCQRLLYLTSWRDASYQDVFFTLGRVWLLIGKARIQFLTLGYGADPMAKYIYKRAQLLHEVKNLDLQIKVREESCALIRGGGDAGVAGLLAKRKRIEDELSSLDAKLVLRPSPPQFKNFCEVVFDFRESLGSCARLDALVKELHENTSSKAMQELDMWQENALAFIQRLSSQFDMYQDLAQPVQLAVYELKYGMSLVAGHHVYSRAFSSFADIDVAVKAISALIQFPSCSSVKSTCGALELASQKLEKVVERIVSMQLPSFDLKATELKLKVFILRAALVRLTNGLIHARTVNKSTLQIVSGLLNSFVNIWKQVREMRKVIEAENTQLIRFKSHELGTDDDNEEALFRELFPSYWSLEAEDASVLMDHEILKPSEKQNDVDRKAFVLEESVMDDVVDIYRRLLEPKLKAVNTEDCSKAFVLAYDSGVSLLDGLEVNLPLEFLKGPGGCQKLSAHLLRIRIEQSRLSKDQFSDFYKDANPSELCKMLDPLGALLRRIRPLLEEWPEHPVLLQIVQFTESVLSIPLQSPLMKALTGLELVLSKAQVWEQNAPKALSLQDELTKVTHLILRWRKMELQTWPSLLQSVMRRHERNADKLWFSFYDLLDKNENLDIVIESAEELLLSAPIGEFGSRLQLVWLFFRDFQIRSSDVSAVLYNVHRYYSRFLPLINESLGCIRAPIEKELTDYVLLSKWEDYNFHSVMASTEKAHRKLHKLTRAFDEHLKGPTIQVLEKAQASESQEHSDASRHHSTEAIERIEDKWASFCKLHCCQLNQEAIQKKVFTTSRVMAELLSSHLFGELTRHHEASTLESLATSIITRSAELKEAKNISMKKKALVDLRRSLKELGLSHLKADVPQHMRSGKGWFKEPVAHLDVLAPCSKLKSGEHPEPDLKAVLLENIMNMWERAESYYYDNISLLQNLHRSSLNYNKDLTLSEVEKFTRYMEHLLYLQQIHRRKIHNFSASLTAISNLNKHFEMIGLELPAKQTAARKLMWDQKDVLDRISQLSVEVELFFGTMKEEFLDASAILGSLILHFGKLRSCKEHLDDILISGSADLHAIYPVIVTDDMLAIVMENFEEMRHVESSVEGILRDYSSRDCAANEVLKPLHALVQEGLELAGNLNCFSSSSSADTSFADEAEKVITVIRLAGQRLAAASQHPDSPKTIHDFENFYKGTMTSFRLDGVYNSLQEILKHMVHCLDEGTDDTSRKTYADFLKSLCPILNIFLAAGMQVLSDYISMQKAVTKLGYVVLQVLNRLFRDGFCRAREDTESDAGNGKFEEAEGTGMGEGEGTKDISEQIEDENQLLSGQETEKPAAEGSDKVEKGIEMEQDFKGELFDISEDECDDEEDDGEDAEDKDEKLEAKMGEQDENAEVVDEKMWDKEEQNLDDTTEKYEQGASVSEMGADDLELRGKEKDDEEPTDEAKDENLQGKPPPDHDEKNENDDKNEGDEQNEGDDRVLDMKDAFEEPSSVKPSVDDSQEAPPDKSGDDHDEEPEEPNPDSEEAELPDKLDIEAPADEDMKTRTEDEGKVEDVEPRTEEGKTEHINQDEEGHENRTTEENMFKDGEHEAAEEAEAGQSVGTQGEDVVIPQQMEAEATEAAKDSLEDKRCDEFACGVATQSDGNPLSQPQSDQQFQADRSSGDAYVSSSLPVREPRAEKLEKLDPNPYRSLGDALQEWKEMARMVMDEKQSSPSDPDRGIREGEADHDGAYKYVSAGEKGTSQALGDATEDQMKENKGLKKVPHENEETDVEPMPEDNASPVRKAEPTSAVAEHELRDRQQYQDLTPAAEPVHSLDAAETMQTDGNEAVEEGSGSFISLVRPYSDVEKHQEVTMREELKAEFATGTRDFESARGIWRKYERLTGRLSQDLAEQLRLILEPTLAARFQGDYKSGKRLNLKKIIPFVASGFKNDRIWLRRTKPNKRQYQVVLVMDDSRSMSESRCGHIALEALITLCRAMTQLEVGELAVVSFGKKGNVRLLHRFDQPFSSEAGVEMIAEFSFSQDNTILDDPMVDLMQNLNQIMDTAGSRVAEQELQQLVLIISDGRFHEKESLRRCVRDAHSRKQLIAYIILDNPLVNMKTVTFTKNGGMSLSRYLDSFPYPYYILLKEMEDLPHTLADLIRQWFELWS